MPASPPRGGGGGAAASSGTPPRGASIDARLAEMPEDLSEDQISNYIKEKCKLDNPMWSFVNAITKKSANVRWSCKVCDKTYTDSPPQKIRAHFLSSLIGCSTCDAAGELRDQAIEAARPSRRRATTSRRRPRPRRMRDACVYCSFLVTHGFVLSWFISRARARDQGRRGRRAGLQQPTALARARARTGRSSSSLRVFGVYLK